MARGLGGKFGRSEGITRFWNRSALAAAALVLGFGSSALAAGVGQPSPWQFGLQTPVTPVADATHDLHTALVWIITLISLFVLGLLIAIVVKFNEKANPVASRTTHHTGLEIAWTIIPVLILVGIAIPSFRLLKFQVELPKPDVTVKVYGNQWYWSYEYPQDQGGGFKFDSNPLEKADAAKANQPYLLAVDNEMVVPTNANVVLQVVGSGRDPLVLGSVPRFPHGRGSRPPEPDLVQDRSRGPVLRPVLAPLRPEPLQHADRRPRGQPG